MRRAEATHDRGNALTRLLVTLVTLGLLAAVAVLLSELNARTYHLSVEGGSLVVSRGRLFPVGTEPYRPADPTLSDAYAPLDLRGHSPGSLAEGHFNERDELDRALFGLEESLARPLVTSDDPKQLEQGFLLLQRMDKLAGLTQEQRQALKALEAEVAYYRGRTLLDEARKDIEKGLAELKAAADSSSHNARSAHQMLSTVEAPAQALDEALRLAVHTLSAPASDGEPTKASPAQ